MCKIGLDIGSTTVKVAVLDKENKIIFSSYQRHFSNINQTVAEVLGGVLDKSIPDGTEFTITVTGSGGIGVSKWLGVPFVQEVLAGTKAIEHYIPDTDVAIELGGEDAKITFLTPSLEQRMNGICAGGTGSFIDQMAALLNTDAMGLDKLAAQHTTLFPIASRCGVFAKTDIQSFLNSGADKADIAASVFQAVVIQTITNLAQGKPIRGNVALLGGPLHFLPQLRERFIQTLQPKEVYTPDNSQIFNALGAALSSGKQTFVAKDIKKNLSTLSGKEEVERLEPLFADKKERDEFDARHAKANVKRAEISTHKGEVFLGIDAGSTTTKVVAINDKAELIYEYYHSNQGAPLESVVNGINEIYKVLPEGAFIAKATVTGYGEHLIKEALNVDYGEVETVAHLTAAEKFLPGLQFILDIGGQDMKAFRVKDGVVVDVLLNEACSSGCGSFIQTFAEALDIQTQEFAKIGLEATAPVNLGSRCTVFMNSSIKQAQKEGASVADISAGLAYSVIKNALFKVIKVRDLSSLGDKIILQGGTFLNQSVLRAFEKLTGKDAVRPDIAGLMGAYGAALISKKNHKAGEKSTITDPSAMKEFSAEKKSYRCKKCTNNCLMTVSTFPDGRRFFTNNRCDEGLPAMMKVEQKEKPVNVYEEKYRRMFEYYKPLELDKATRGQVGIPRVLNMYENYPFWHTFFTSLGYSVVISPDSSREIYNMGMTSMPSESVCYPAKLVHGHIESLVQSGLKFIFYPALPLEQNEFAEADNHYNCPIVATYPEAIRMNMTESFGDTVRFMSPFLPYHCEKKLLKRLKQEFSEISNAELKKAVTLAYEEDGNFKRDIRAMGTRAIKKMEETGGHGIILAGRPYHLDKELNHGIPRMISSYDFTVFTEDSVAHLARLERPIRIQDQWMYHTRLFHAVSLVAERNDLDLLHMNSFGCGLDAVITDVIKEMLEEAGKIYTAIKIDEISNLGAARIRVRSLMAVLEERKKRGEVKQKGLSKPKERVVFTKEMRKTHTLLFPQMSPVHFSLLRAGLMKHDLNIEILKDSKDTIETGLKYVNNDSCYPSVIVIGSVISALQSGKYDLDKVAVAIQQTGGGCRSSNYITMLRLALKQANMEDIPVVSINVDKDSEKNPGFKMTLPVIKQMGVALILGDLLMRVTLRVRPYEVTKGETDALYEKWDKYICEQLMAGKANVGQIAKQVVAEFDAIKIHDVVKPRIGVVGEIYVKYHPLSNNYLVDFIEAEGCEAVVPDITDFMLYGLFANNVKHELLGGSKFRKILSDITVWYVEGMRKPIVKALTGTKFGTPSHIKHMAELAKPIVSTGNLCGEGWFLTAEMIELLTHGVNNIVCTQPFGCLPNHVTGKGALKALKAKYPKSNLVAVDYDPGASEVNQINRIKLMLSVAFKDLGKKD